MSDESDVIEIARIGEVDSFGEKLNTVTVIINGVCLYAYESGADKAKMPKRIIISAEY